VRPHKPELARHRPDGLHTVAERWRSAFVEAFAAGLLRGLLALAPADLPRLELIARMMGRFHALAGAGADPIRANWKNACNNALTQACPYLDTSVFSPPLAPRSLNTFPTWGLSPQSVCTMRSTLLMAAASLVAPFTNP